MIYLRTLSKGWTLPEVCVALAVLLIGTTAILGAWNFFNREVADECLRLERFNEVLSTMESLIAERPMCADSAALSQTSAASRSPESRSPEIEFSQMSVEVRLKRVPGHRYLVWAVVELDGFSLKRLVRCR